MASVLITGTSRGIGFETALAFARAGYKVHATMRNPSQSPELGEIAGRERLPIVITAMDVMSDGSVRDAFAHIQREHEPIDVLVNNAGVERSSSVEELSLDDFHTIMETNYFGALRCIKQVLPQMRERRSGCIINVSSVAGRLSSPPLTAYCASKWALEGLTEGLAGEMKTFNVRVVAVEPGIIDTSMARRIENHESESLYRQAERFASLFQASLEQPHPVSLVAEKILAIAQSDTWQLRHTVGPDAAPFLQWRASMTNEEWVALHGADDDTWYRRIEQDFGMDTRPRKKPAAA
jgi:NAD(P)-dependent dehydrogenase (short-subunit alcohol dehydrogenase family)